VMRPHRHGQVQYLVVGCVCVCSFFQRWIDANVFRICTSVLKTPG